MHGVTFARDVVVGLLGPMVGRPTNGFTILTATPTAIANETVTMTFNSAVMFAITLAPRSAAGYI